MNRGVAWYRLEDGLVREFIDSFDTEIVSAFFLGASRPPTSRAPMPWWTGCCRSHQPRPCSA